MILKTILQPVIAETHLSIAEYEKYRCNSCGALMRGKKNLLSKEKKDSLMVRL